MSQINLAKKQVLLNQQLLKRQKLHSISLRIFVKMLSALDSELKIMKSKGDNNGTR